MNPFIACFYNGPIDPGSPDPPQPMEAFMHRQIIAILALTLSLAATAADWTYHAADLSAGASPPATLTLYAGAGPASAVMLEAGANPPTTASWASLPFTNAAAANSRTNVLLTASVTTLLRSAAYLGQIQPYTNDAVLRLCATTSGVHLILAAWTNGSPPYAPAVPLALLAGDTVYTAATNQTNAVAIAASLQTHYASTQTLAEARALYAAIPSRVQPTNDYATLSLTAVTSGVSVTFATFTNASPSYAPAACLDLGTGSVFTLTAAAGVTGRCSVVLVTRPRISARHTATAPTLLRSATPAGAVLSTYTNAGVTFTAVTSGVTVTLATFTNVTDAVAPGLWLRPGDSWALAPDAPVTNLQGFAFSYQTAVSNTVAAAPGSCVRVHSIRTRDAVPILPATNAVAVSVRYAGNTSATFLCVLTNGAAAYAPATPLALYDGDLLDLTPVGVTNLPAFRAELERQN